MSMSEAQQIALAIAPKFTALASICGSSCLIYLNARYINFLNPESSSTALAVSGRRSTNIRRSQQHRTSAIKPISGSEATYHRLVLGLAFSDLFASVAWFLTTWPIPKETPDVYGAVGNEATCSIQGFFTQSSLVAVMYNLALSIYFVLVVVKSWKKEQILKVEPYIHALAILVGFGTSIPLLALGSFNQAVWDCWIAPAPLGCQESWSKGSNGVTTCVRGDNASYYRWIFYYGPLWVIIVFIVALMCILFFHVRGVEQQLQQNYSTMRLMQSSARSNSRSGGSNHSKGVMKQALYYVGAFFVTWLFPTIFQIVFVAGNHLVLYPLLFLTAFFIPIQGALNLMVYLQPKFVAYRAKQKRLIRQRQREAEIEFAAQSEDQELDSSAETTTSEQQPNNITTTTTTTSPTKPINNESEESLIVAWFNMFWQELTFQTDVEFRPRNSTISGRDTSRISTISAIDRSLSRNV